MAATLSGCAQPSQKYAKDVKEGIYFAVPNSYLEIAEKDLATTERKNSATGATERADSVIWQIAYAPNPKFTAADVLNIKTPDKPIVYMRARNLLSHEINSISYNSMRDVIVPITSWIDGTKTAPDFDITIDEEMVQKGARGIHTVFWFQGSDGQEQTVNQTSLLSTDHTKIYILIIRCSTKCYSKNSKELTKIASSLHIRGPK